MENRTVSRRLRITAWLAFATFFFVLGAIGLYASSHAVIGYYGVHPSLESVLFCQWASIGLIITGVVFVGISLLSVKYT